MPNVNVLCRLLSKEAEAISNYTDEIAAVEESDTAAALEELRFGKLEHVQSLTLLLSEALMPDSSGDGDNGPAGEEGEA